MANRVYWTSNVDFKDAACKVIKAAYDAGMDVLMFMWKFHEVGIDAKNNCGYVQK